MAARRLPRGVRPTGECGLRRCAGRSSSIRRSARRAGNRASRSKKITYDRGPVRARAELDLPAGHGDLEFNYTGLDYRSPLGITFRYRLEGFDQEWTDAFGRRAAFYTNVPPGRYVFRVIARNKDGEWDPWAPPCRSASGRIITRRGGSLPCAAWWPSVSGRAATAYGCEA